MKKIIKSEIFIGIILGIIFGCITVYASTKVKSIAVTYTPSDSTFEVDNVDDALNYLFDKMATYVEFKQFCKLQSGTHLTIGAEYLCDPGDGIERTFYILSIKNNSVNLIMDRNIISRSITYDNAIKYFKGGSAEEYDYQTLWKNVLDISLPSAQEIVDAVGASYEIFNYGGEQYTWCLSDPTVGSCSTTENSSSVAWLFNHLYQCEEYGCTDGTESNKISSYWTRNYNHYTGGYYGGSYYYTVTRVGGLGWSKQQYDVYSGLRPVITVLKSNLYT